MCSRASEVGSSDNLSHKSVKSYTLILQILFFVVVSAMYLHKTFFLQTYCWLYETMVHSYHPYFSLFFLNFELLIVQLRILGGQEKSRASLAAVVIRSPIHSWRANFHGSHYCLRNVSSQICCSDSSVRLLILK